MDSLFLTKVIAAIITGTLGLLSAVSDFRNKKSGRLTKIGRTAISLIVASLLVAVWAEIKEQRKSIVEANKAAKERAEQLATQLDEYTRILQGVYGANMPLENVEATLEFEVDYGSVQTYAKRLNDAIKNWKADEPKRAGFLSLDLLAPGIAQQTKGAFGQPVQVKPAQDELNFAKSLQPTQTVIGIKRGERHIEGRFRIFPPFTIIPKMDRSHIMIQYRAVRIEWSDLKSEDSSLLSFVNCPVEIRSNAPLSGTVLALGLRVPSNHRLVVSEIKKVSDTAPVFSGVLKEP